MTAPPVQAARELGPLLREHAGEGERIRRLPAASVQALTDAGLMRMCVSGTYDGPELDPMTIVEAIAQVAHADGAAGWCSMIASTTSSLSSFMEPDAARTIFADPAVVTGGVAAPNGAGVRTTADRGDGVVVSGRWAWGSGTQHCDWVLGGARIDETWTFCFFPQSAVTFYDTWHTGGMRGSGSLDYSVEDEFVPDEFTLEPGAMRPQVESPLARFPNFTLLASGVAAVGLGIARRALDELVEIAQGKRPQFSKRTLAESGYTQAEVARAEATLRSARAFLLDELATAWRIAQDGERVPIDNRVGIRLAAAHAATAATSVADTAFTLAGGNSVYDTSVLGRCSRDAHVVTQHIQTAPKLHEPLGKALLHQDVDTSMF